MSASCRLRARFDTLAGLTRAAEQIKAAGFTEYEVYSPVLPHEEFEEHMPRKSSVVRWFSVAGGLAGVAIGLGMCILSSALYELITGGKPWESLVPFVVVGFECTILFACLATVASLAYFARLRPLAPPPEYDPRFSDDRYGMTVACAPERKAAAARLLQAAGAADVQESDGTGA